MHRNKHKKKIVAQYENSPSQSQQGNTQYKHSHCIYTPQFSTYICDSEKETKQITFQ